MVSSGVGGQCVKEISVYKQMGELVDILKSFTRGKASVQKGLLNEMIVYEGRRMVEVLVDLLT